MRRAAKIDRNQPEIVAALRKHGCNVQSLAAMGGGIPDLLVSPPERGRFVLIEIKDGKRPPSERKLTKDQLEWHADWIGTPVFIVETVEQALAAIQ